MRVEPTPEDRLARPGTAIPGPAGALQERPMPFPVVRPATRNPDREP